VQTISDLLEQLVQYESVVLIMHATNDNNLLNNCEQAVRADADKQRVLTRVPNLGTLLRDIPRV
jgi:hypothetical protein